MAFDDTKIRKQEKEETSKRRTENRTTHLRKQTSSNTNQDRHCIRPKQQTSGMMETELRLRNVTNLDDERIGDESVRTNTILTDDTMTPKQRTDD